MIAMRYIYRSLILFAVLFSLWGVFASSVFASETVGSIEGANHFAQVCENTGCTTTSTSPVNFGNFTTIPSANVVVIDSELSGYIWGTGFGWAVLNCSNTTSGCSTTNANFHVANDAEGHLSGYGWGENTGWINFGPFTNSATQSVTINSDGEFSGYAWAQNFGWIKFDCSNPDTCTRTDWRPLSVRNTGTSGGSSTSGSGTIGTGTAGTTAPGGTGTAPGTGPGGTTGPSTPPGTGPSTPGPATPTVPGTPTTPTTPTSPSTPGTGPGGVFGGIIDTINSYPIGKAVFDQVTQSFNIARAALGDASDEIRAALETPEGNIAYQAASLIGIVSGASLSIASTLFANPLSFSEIFLIPVRLWALLMAALGLKRRNKPWGTVYDSVTKQPLDPAYVVLQDMQGNEVATSITDLDGRYGFLLSPGTYQLVAHKTNYQFPSTRYQGGVHDPVYNDLYLGGPIVITQEGQTLTKNIPMDPLKFDWNEFAKKEQHLMKFYSKRNVWLNHISNLLFAFGFTITTIAVLVNATTYNLAIFGLYCVLFILKRTILKPRAQGSIVEKATGQPLSFAVIRVFSAGTDHEVIHKITDKTGKYYCLIPNGTYYVKIERKNADETYTSVFASQPFQVTKGYLDKKFEI